MGAKLFDMRNIIEVNKRIKAAGLRQLLGRHGVGREHNIRTMKAASIREHQLRGAGAVHAAALLLQNAQDRGIGQRLDGEILLEILAPAERLIQRPRRAADPALVIQVKRRRELRRRLRKHFIRQTEIRHFVVTPSSKSGLPVQLNLSYPPPHCKYFLCIFIEGYAREGASLIEKPPPSRSLPKRLRVGEILGERPLL